MRNAHRRNTVHHPLSTIRELAAWLQIHPAALYRAAQTGEIPASKAGGRWRFSRDAVEYWILDRMNAQTALIEEPGPWLLDFSRPRRARLWNVAAWVQASAWPWGGFLACPALPAGLIVAAQRVACGAAKRGRRRAQRGRQLRACRRAGRAIGFEDFALAERDPQTRVRATRAVPRKPDRGSPGVRPVKPQR
jgi:excisionase family DNA binding protein